MGYDILRWERGKMCRNRSHVTGPERRRHSPVYDDDGDPGNGWLEMGDADVMCTAGYCTGTDSEVWLRATNVFFEKKFRPGYDKLKTVIASSGMPGTDPQRRVLDDAKQLMDGWQKHQAAVKADPPSVWNAFRLWGVIETTVNYFDEGSCLLENDIDVEICKIRPGLCGQKNEEGLLGPAPGGGPWVGGGRRPGQPPKPPASPAAIAAGVVLLGAASYFGFKVLTE